MFMETGMYVVCFVNDYSGYAFVYFLKMAQESELVSVFERFNQESRLMVATRDAEVLPSKLVLHSDNAKVYRGAAFTEQCQRLGYTQTFSPPHTQSQNGYFI
mmetsp:Transcript_16316/g.28205  ORF Transcript_16316/g.28205 Transcript_16316/m.28205 type:complete len:102 (+) Transcript_16316:145-450(+)